MMVTILSLFASSCNDDEVIETSVQVTTQGFARVGQTTAFVSAYITKGTVSDNKTYAIPLPPARGSEGS